MDAELGENAGMPRKDVAEPQKVVADSGKVTAESRKFDDDDVSVTAKAREKAPPRKKKSPAPNLKSHRRVKKRQRPARTSLCRSRQGKKSHRRVRKRLKVQAT